MNYAHPTQQAPPIEVAPRLLSNVQELRHKFTGRDALLRQICEELGSGPKKNVLVLHGIPGVGKSELAREVGRRLHQRYPGGTFEIDFKLGPEVPLAQIGRKNLGLTFAADLKPADQAQQTLVALFASQALLIYDNVTNQENLTEWLPVHGAQCQVLITSFLERWEGWWAIEVEPLPLQDSVKLVENLAGVKIASQLGKQLATTSGGLPVELCPAAVALAAEYRRWKELPQLPSKLSRESEQSFKRAYQLLDSEAQLLLQGISFLGSQRAPLREIANEFQQALGWDEAKVRHLANGCIDLHLLQGGEELRMHQTVAGFVVRTGPSRQQKGLLAKIREVQTRRLIEIAELVETNPARADLAAILLLFPLTPERWQKHPTSISVVDGETIGRALYEIGRFKEAQPWFERAVQEKKQGDAHSPVDHDSLGTSLHVVGYCLFQMGKHEEAQPWFERAVQETEQGDLHGRVNHESLGNSLHQVAHCLFEKGQYTEAQTWVERAAKEIEQGGVHGRVNHDWLGRSLHLVGHCLARTGKYAEAQTWFERAVREKEQGDTYGRVDHETLGSSLHLVGYCLGRAGKHSEAQTWFERAVREKEQGDEYGRVNHDSLSRSTHAVGDCLSQAGKYMAALSWYKRAVKEAEQGDVHGRLDHESLGCSLHRVGYCLAQTGKHAEAQSWFERAMQEKEQGDVHGRVDQESLRLTAEALRNFKLWLERANDAGKEDISGTSKKADSSLGSE